MCPSTLPELCCECAYWSYFTHYAWYQSAECSKQGYNEVISISMQGRKWNHVLTCCAVYGK